MIKATVSNSEGTNLAPTPAGSHNAVCYGVWNLGYQKTVWDGQEKTQHKIVIAWEIDRLIETEGEYNGKRFVISKQYTLSLGRKANLRADLESWLGKVLNDREEIDLELLVGRPAMLSIVHVEKNGKTYANVKSVMALPAGMMVLKPENTTEPPAWVIKKQSEAVVNSEAEVKQAFDAINVKNDPSSIAFAE